MIVYPSNLTKRQQLELLYPVIEQGRLWHNQEGARVRSNPELKPNWWLYAKRPAKLGGNDFWQKIMPLLQEQNKLRDAIRRNAYTDREWMELSGEDRAITFFELFGNKWEILKGIKISDSLELVYPSFKELKRISLESLLGMLPPDPTQDLTTYTEVDPGTDLTVDADKVLAVSGYDTGSNTWVTKSGFSFEDFEHLFHFKTSAKPGMIWAIADDYHTEVAMDTANNGIRCTGSSDNLFFKDETNSNQDSGSFTRDVDRYATVERASTTGTFKWYEEEGRLTLEDALTITTGTQTYTYMNAMGSIGSGSDTGYLHYLGDLDLQEAAPSASIPVMMHHYHQMAKRRIN